MLSKQGIEWKYSIHGMEWEGNMDGKQVHVPLPNLNNPRRFFPSGKSDVFLAMFF